MMRHVNKMAGKPEMMRSNHEVTQYFGVEMLPCPFCAGPPALYMGPSPHVVCTKCAAEGPVFESRRDNLDAVQHRAVLAWNARA
jgi:hypothetical protein